LSEKEKLPGVAVTWESVLPNFANTKKVMSFKSFKKSLVLATLGIHFGFSPAFTPLQVA